MTAQNGQPEKLAPGQVAHLMLGGPLHGKVGIFSKDTKIHVDLASASRYQLQAFTRAAVHPITGQPANAVSRTAMCHESVTSQAAWTLLADVLIGVWIAADPTPTPVPDGAGQTGQAPTPAPTNGRIIKP